MNLKICGLTKLVETTNKVINSVIKELPDHFLAVLKNYFEQYKVLENKVVLIDEFQDKETAYRVIQDSITRYQTRFPDNHATK